MFDMDDVRSSVRRGENPESSLGMAIRLICNSDTETQTAIDIMAGGGGYRDLRDAGLTVLEATRTMAVGLLFREDESEGPEITGNGLFDLIDQGNYDIKYLAALFDQIDDPVKKTAMIAAALAGAMGTFTEDQDIQQMHHIIESDILPLPVNGVQPPSQPVNIMLSATGENGLTEEQVLAMIAENAPATGEGGLTEEQVLAMIAENAPATGEGGLTEEQVLAMIHPLLHPIFADISRATGTGNDAMARLNDVESHMDEFRQRINQLESPMM